MSWAGRRGRERECRDTVKYAVSSISLNRPVRGTKELSSLDRCDDPDCGRRPWVARKGFRTHLRRPDGGLVGPLQLPVEKLRSCLHNEHIAALRFKYARITCDKLASAIVSVL
jgi:hypothetical protein